MRREEAITRNAELSEKAIEKYLGEQTKAHGGVSLKYSSGVSTGYPDRLLLFPGGHTIWVEVKSKGKNATPLQAHRMNVLREQLGFPVFLVDSKEKADLVMMYAINMMKG